MGISTSFYLFYGLKIPNISWEDREKCENDFNHMVVTNISIGLYDQTEFYIGIRSSIVEFGREEPTVVMDLNNVVMEHPEWDFILNMVVQNFNLTPDNPPRYIVGISQL